MSSQVGNVAGRLTGIAGKSGKILIQTINPLEVLREYFDYTKAAEAEQTKREEIVEAPQIAPTAGICPRGAQDGKAHAQEGNKAKHTRHPFMEQQPAVSSPLVQDAVSGKAEAEHDPGPIPDAKCPGREGNEEPQEPGKRKVKTALRLGETTQDVQPLRARQKDEDSDQHQDTEPTDLQDNAEVTQELRQSQAPRPDRQDGQLESILHRPTSWEFSSRLPPVPGLIRQAEGTPQQLSRPIMAPGRRPHLRQH